MPKLKKIRRFKVAADEPYKNDKSDLRKKNDLDKNVIKKLKKGDTEITLEELDFSHLKKVDVDSNHGTSSNKVKQKVAIRETNR